MSDQFPTYRAQMEYVCLGCGARHPIDELLYTCPDCGGVFLLEDTTFDRLKEHGALLAQPVRQPGRHPQHGPARRVPVL